MLILVHLPAVAAAVDVAAARQSLLFLRAIRWIMGVPAGLKLNDALDYCLGNLCILGVKCFQVVYMLAQPHLPAVLRALALSGLGGLTVMLSLAADLLSVATLHIAVFYALAARWHGVQTRVLGSLWRLFRGRKRNVLRGRIDACDYSLDQLVSMPMHSCRNPCLHVPSVSPELLALQLLAAPRDCALHHPRLPLPDHLRVLPRCSASPTGSSAPSSLAPCACPSPASTTSPSPPALSASSRPRASPEASISSLSPLRFPSPSLPAPSPLPSLHASRTATSEVDGRARPWAARHSALQAAADSDHLEPTPLRERRAAAAAGSRSTRARAWWGSGTSRCGTARRLNEIGGAAEGGLAEGGLGEQQAVAAARQRATPRDARRAFCVLFAALPARSRSGRSSPRTARASPPR